MYFFISNNCYIYLNRYFEIFVTYDFKYILEDSCFKHNNFLNLGLNIPFLVAMIIFFNIMCLCAFKIYVFHMRSVSICSFFTKIFH